MAPRVVPRRAAPRAAPPPIRAPRPVISQRRTRDAHHDRVILGPTAETNPEGSFYLTSYEIIIGQVGYSLSDKTQLSITATPPLGDDEIIPADISVKTVILREPVVSVALIASASGILNFDEFSGFLGRAGGAVTLCDEAERCAFSVSFGTNVALAGPASVWFNSVGATWRLGSLVSLLAEVDTLLPLAEPVGEANGVLGGLAIRLSGSAWGIDLGLMRAAKAQAPASETLPFLAVTYRYLP